MINPCFLLKVLVLFVCVILIYCPPVQEETTESTVTEESTALPIINCTNSGLGQLFVDPYDNCSNTFYVCTQQSLQITLMAEQFHCPDDMIYNRKSQACELFEDIPHCSGIDKESDVVDMEGTGLVAANMPDMKRVGRRRRCFGKCLRYFGKAPIQFCLNFCQIG